ncbi:EpsG family protein [Treponema phagedenis]|uniref:EpsG family protein n=1 Tax=Treponema phagedenis TaxID=162 RepID=UPI00197E517C|nr:EpsG family protein [Treponema phagedenis]QSH93527.1 hypothetical protein C5O78_00365 [Treponema phagedenis]
MIFPYFIPPVFAFLASIFEKGFTNSIKKAVYILLSLSAIFIYCCVYLNGSDWPAYEIFFNEINFNNLIKEACLRGFEIGFSFSLLFLKTLGLNFMLSLIVMKIFSFVLISNFFYTFAQSEYAQGYAKNIFFLLFIFYTTNCMYLYVETIIRFSIALAIVIKSYKYLFLRKFFPFMFLLFLAFLFHRTAIIVLPLYFIKQIKLSTKWLCVVFAGIFIFLSPQSLLFFAKLIFGSSSSVFSLKLIGYLELVIQSNEVNPFAIGNIVHLLFLILILVYRKQLEKHTAFNKQFFVGLILFFFIYFTTMYMGPIGRVRLFYSIFFIIAIAELFSIRYMLQTFAFTMSICFWIFGMYKSIDENYCFKYYTNYLTATLEKKSDLSLYDKLMIYYGWEQSEVFNK